MFGRYRHVAVLAAPAASMWSFGVGAWRSGVGFLEPFSGVPVVVRADKEVAAKPAQAVEEEDAESVDLYKGSFSPAYASLTLLRDTEMHLKRNR